MKSNTHVNALFDLSNKTAIVTGGIGYLGSPMATALAEAGCRLVVTSRNADRAIVFAQSLPSPNNAEHIGITLDYMDADSIKRGFSDAVEQTGGVDILVNNGQDGMSQDWTNVTPAAFNRQLANATGYFLLSRAFRNHVTKRNVPGSVIMLGSMYGIVGSYPEVYQDLRPYSPVAYHVLKAGILQMTRHLAVCWAKDNVRVNSISPGPFPHKVTGEAEEFISRLVTKCPMNRVGNPNEIKGAVVFLASQASSYITGQNVSVDGGWTAW